ncbi:MAG: DEAD/DEAH box helicase family protein [Clostridia bacterium]|nr:DEAD/DEAH box helicase family protein [Clostridia bacterium]
MSRSRVYVSDLIGDDYINWKPKDNILISTQTGSGKTSFIIRTLLPYAVEHDKCVVYICNRKTLLDQTEEIIKKHIRDVYLNDCEFAEKCISKMIIRTYQSCEIRQEFPGFKEEIENDNNNRKSYKHFSTEDIMYYVFDEAHYFVQDALFNSSTNYWYNKSYNHAITVFLTATPEPLFCFLHRARFNKNSAHEFYKAMREYRRRRKEIDMPSKSVTLGFNELGKFSVLPPEDHEECDDNKKADGKKEKKIIENLAYKVYFDIVEEAITDTSELIIYDSSYKKVDYSYVNSYYFEEYDDILDIITYAYDKGKWVIFVDSEKEGKSIFNKLTTAGKKVAFISSSTKPYKKFNSLIAHNQLIEKQSFDFDVLITTSVLDCGVSICDKSVKNIVISAIDKTTFLQMLGRIRVDNQKINVHIKCYEGRKTNYRRHMYEIALEYVVTYSLLAETVLRRTSHWSNESDGLADKLILSDNEVRRLIYKPNTGNQQLLYPHINTEINRKRSQGDTSYQKQIIQYDHSQAALLNLAYSLYSLNRATDSEKKDKNRFLFEQLSWIGHQYNEENWSVYELCRNKLCSILEKYAENKTFIDKSEQIDFASNCVRIMIKTHNISPYIKTLWTKFNHKKIKKIGMNSLNKALVSLELPYQILSKQKMKNGIRQTRWQIQKLDSLQFKD